jgi:hypothetical protein
LNNHVGGNLQFVENKTGPYEIKNNTIKGDLQFFKNKGSGVITENNVEGNLQSKENDPPPTISDNIVKGDIDIERVPGKTVNPSSHIFPLLLDK